jgi:hypothetical protein
MLDLVFENRYDVYAWYKRTKNTCRRTRKKASNISMIQTFFEMLNKGKALEHNDEIAAHEAKICAIICKNRAYKQKPQNK